MESFIDSIDRDIDLLLWSANLATMPRFYDQPFWEEEGAAYRTAMAYEGNIRLESVADHSWKVADAIIILADRFKEVNYLRCIELAIIHDKLELFTDDLSPIDEEGTGLSTHAFNEDLAKQKTKGELHALELYLEMLRPEQRKYHRDLYLELINTSSIEAQFVRGVDKLVSLIYVIQRKNHKLLLQHYRFTIAYAAKSYQYFNALRPYYTNLVSRLDTVT